MQELGGRSTAGFAAFAGWVGLTSTWTPPGVLKGCDTPGVADEIADGMVMSSPMGCRGLGGGGAADTEGFPSL